MVPGMMSSQHVHIRVDVMKNQSSQKDSHKAQYEAQSREIYTRLQHMTHKILVMSGKGGVGKSSVAVHLALALAARGKRVGLMDVDLHGPSIPRMLGLQGTVGPGRQEGKMRPVLHSPNLEVMSIEVLMGDKDAATIWRGPLKGGVIRQFIADIEWSELDYLVIDSPPGTGDEPLSVAQNIPQAKALIVTTPQEVSLADVRKSINFCRQVHMDIIGLVENMSGFTCPNCGQVFDLFKTGGGQRTAQKENLRLLGTLPIEPQVVQNADRGALDLLTNDQLPFNRAFEGIVDAVEESLAESARAAAEAAAQAAAGRKPSNGNRLVVIPVSGGKLDPHFGHCEQFAFIETHDGQIGSTRLQAPPAHEPGVLPQWLHEQGADVAIVGGMGDQARDLLTQNGIEVIIGAPVDAPEALVRHYLADSLTAGENLCTH